MTFFDLTIYNDNPLLIKLCTELDLLPNFERFPYNICDRCGMCHRCLYETVAWYWLGWRESPLAQSVEHWSRKPKDPSSNPGGCSANFHNCICICDNGAPTWIRCLFVWQNIPCQTCKSATEPPISRTRFLVEGDMSQVFVRTSRLILTRLEGIPFSSFDRALVS